MPRSTAFYGGRSWPHRTYRGRYTGRPQPCLGCRDVRIRYKTEDNPPIANVPLIGYSLEYDCKVALVYRKGDNYYTNMECDVEYKTSSLDEYEYVYP